ncbi:MAG: MFS transporter, partial [Planctomycetota bacterium]
MALTSRSSRAGRLAVITCGHLVVDMYGGFLPPLIPVLREHLGVKLSAMTTLAGVCMVVVNGIQPLTGLAPQASGRWGLLIGPVLAMALALLGVSRDFAVVAALAVVGYAGVGLYHPRGLLTAHALSGSRENVGVPIFLSGGFFGVSLAGVVSTQWVSRFGLGSFWVLAAAGVGVAALCGGAGLHRRVAQVGRHDAAAPRASSAPHFGLIFALGVVMVSTTCVLLVFLNEDLTSRWGPEGIRWGGAAYAL